MMQVGKQTSHAANNNPAAKIWFSTKVNKVEMDELVAASTVEEMSPVSAVVDPLLKLTEQNVQQTRGTDRWSP